MKQFFLRRGKLLIYTFYFLLFFLLLLIWHPANAKVLISSYGESTVVALRPGVYIQAVGLILPSRRIETREGFLTFEESRGVCIGGGSHSAETVPETTGVANPA